jgi:glycosyltransferase involved in cell wall biosynthesis
MVVMEAILSGIPLVLADNEDMRRFNLDNKHYFNSYERLVAIIENNIKNEFKDLRVSRKISNVLMHERSLKNVTDRWINALGALALDTPTV